jgi:hypothetical protein
MTVVPMVFGSALCMIAGSLLTRPPSQATIDKYFPKQMSKSFGRGTQVEPALGKVASAAH